MHYTIRLLAAALAFMTFSGNTSNASPFDPPNPAPTEAFTDSQTPSQFVAGDASLGETPVVTIDATQPAEGDLAMWAVNRFAAAGLELPDLTITFPGSDQSLCGGVPARAFVAAQPPEIKVCWSNRFILLHELAHVWEAHALDEATREGFANLRDGVEGWYSPDVQWSGRGAEHAANVIAWGLLEDPYPVSRTYPNDVDSMLEAYRYLTGMSPLHDGGEGIVHPDRSLYQGRTNPSLESGR
jgi:hypothetical protein